MMELSQRKLAFTLVLTAFIGTASAFWTGSQQTGEIGVVSLEGQIMPGQPGLAAAGITPDEVRSKIETAEAEGSDAILVEINSGGGSVVASKDMMRILEETEIYTVCRLRDLGASGAYMAALGCDDIVADKLTLTGSIGVTASYLEFSDLMNELGIDYVEIMSGEDKEEGNPLREPSEEEIESLTNRSETVHEHFREIVIESRSLEDEDIVHSGAVVLGEDAKEAGLVDELGGRQEAVELAENETGMNLNEQEVSTTPEFSLLNILLGGINTGFVSETEVSLEATL